jgi:DNA-binding NarL/FixJ family response regulator
VTGQRPITILIVEDEFLVAMELEASLLEVGWRVCGVAASAEQAIALAVQERPNLVIMDIRLLGPRDGIEAATEIYQATGIRSIFVTAHADNKTKDRAKPAEPLAWIAKPYAAHTVINAIRHATL